MYLDYRYPSRGQKIKGATSGKAAALAALPVVPAMMANHVATNGMNTALGQQGQDGKGKKKKPVLRAAGGEAWEDPTLTEWDNSECLFMAEFRRRGGDYMDCRGY